MCQANPDLQLERSPNGELVIVSPTGGEGGSREASLMAKVVVWNEQTQSSAGNISGGCFEQA